MIHGSRACLTVPISLIVSLGPSRPTQRPCAPGPTIALVGAAYDTHHHQLIIVGSAPDDSVAQSWTWTNAGWTKASVTGPSAREEPLLVYDANRRRVVLHGGYHGSTVYADTWEWDGNDWMRVATEGPPPRGGGAMAYDSRRGRVVLFGGASVGPGLEHNDLWEWDGARWHSIVPDQQPGAPAGRGLHGLAYDSARGRLVVYGGFVMGNGRPHPIDDTATWEWDGGRWLRRDAGGPGPRDHVAMVYDPVRQAVILHGGANPPTTGLLGDTWRYDGTRWQRLLDGGPPRGRHRLVYDDRARAVLLYGGWGPKEQLPELWQLDATRWRRLPDAIVRPTRTRARPNSTIDQRVQHLHDHHVAITHPMVIAGGEAMCQKVGV